MELKTCFQSSSDSPHPFSLNTSVTLIKPSRSSEGLVESFFLKLVFPCSLSSSFFFPASPPPLSQLLNLLGAGGVRGKGRSCWLFLIVAG